MIRTLFEDKTVIVISHDEEDGGYDRVLRIDGGKLQPQGTQRSIENTEGIKREYDFTTEKHLSASVLTQAGRVFQTSDY